MKLKVDQTRTYDDAGFRRRAACLCFKSEREIEVLLVTSSRNHDLWVVPGGGVEPGEEPETSAVREANEEAGVVGKIDRRIDIFENKERNTRTYVYVLFVESLDDEYDDLHKIGRLRKWFSLDEAIDKLSEHRPIQQKYIVKLCQDKIHQKKMSCYEQIPSNLNYLVADPNISLNKRSECHQTRSQTLPHSCDGDNNADNKLSLHIQPKRDGLKTDKDLSLLIQGSDSSRFICE